MAFHYSLFLSREAHPAQRIHCLCGSAMLPSALRGENSKQKRALFFLILNISFRKGHPYPLNYKLARKGRCCFFFFCRLENLSFASPPCLHSGWFASSFAQALGSPLLCCIFLWSPASVCVFRIAGIRRWFPIYLNVSSMFWAAHLVSSAITAGSPCGCSAAYSPFAYLTLPKHIFFSYLFRSASCR